MKIQEKIFWGLSLATSVLALACSSTEDTNAGIGGYNNTQGIAPAGTAGLNTSAPGQGGITIVAAGGTTGSVAQAGAGGATPTAGAGTKTAGAGGVAGRAGTGGKAGKGGASGKSGAGGKGGTGGTAGRGECPKSTLTGDQVIFIGDSYLDTTTSQIAPELENLWQKDGSPAYSANPRYYQVMARLMDDIVGRQYDEAKAENPDIKLTIMIGGGNDVLIANPQCLTASPLEDPTCAAACENNAKLLKDSLDKQEADGVKNVVFLFYPHTPPSNIFNGETPVAIETADYSQGLSRPVCEKSPICTFVWLGEAAGDTIGSEYKDQNYIGPDGVHPSAEGSKVFAEYIWKKMKENCIAWK